MSNEPILITRPTLPDLGSYDQLISQIWRTHILTNCSSLHNRLEADLAKYLGMSKRYQHAGKRNSAKKPVGF